MQIKWISTYVIDELSLDLIMFDLTGEGEHDDCGGGDGVLRRLEQMGGSDGSRGRERRVDYKVAAGGGVVCISICICICIYVCIYMHIYMHMYIYLYLYVYVYVYI